MMTTKICIIGNSHIAALKVAVRDSFFQSDTLGFVFWGVRGRKFLEVKFESGRLVSPDPEFALVVSGGTHATINPSDFGALVFHGPINYTSFIVWFRKLRRDSGTFSASFLVAGMKSHLHAKPTNALIRQIRSSYKGRILVSPQPLVSEESAFFGDQIISGGERAETDRILQEYFEQIGAEYLAQPESTIVDNKYTAKKYSINSVALIGDLNIKHPPNEHFHMNGCYGAEVLRTIYRKLNSK
ncbi:MAG TPA: hypothetical protein VHC71_14945 [Hyphomicrobium sp.]|nr:hypothetical protein [Rhizomicrobium sp.]HVX37509.1 hypothetical protein [Hyphomicrobium sp.]